jgi:hypothetical protein
MSKSLKVTGEEAWKRVEKVNGELFVLTYGAVVAQLCRDCGAAGIEGVNEELYKMYNVLEVISIYSNVLLCSLMFSYVFFCSVFKGFQYRL